jgi:hypothetical protein
LHYCVTQSNDSCPPDIAKLTGQEVTTKIISSVWKNAIEWIRTECNPYEWKQLASDINTATNMWWVSYEWKKEWPKPPGYPQLRQEHLVLFPSQQKTFHGPTLKGTWVEYGKAYEKFTMTPGASKLVIMLWKDENARDRCMKYGDIVEQLFSEGSDGKDFWKSIEHRVAEANDFFRDSKLNWSVSCDKKLEVVFILNKPPKKKVVRKSN